MKDVGENEEQNIENNIINIKNESKINYNHNIKSEKAFNQLKEIQLLLKRESALKELCKINIF